MIGSSDGNAYHDGGVFWDEQEFFHLRSQIRATTTEERRFRGGGPVRPPEPLFA